MRTLACSALVLVTGLMSVAIVHAAPFPAGPLGSSSQSTYLLPSMSGTALTPLLTVGDAAGNGYRMAGIPDGLGAFDNGDGTFTLLMNHELGTTAGGARTHAPSGAFVSEWVIDKSTLTVLSGRDQIQTVNLLNTSTGQYQPAINATLTRLCSADLPAPTAFFNPASGLGTGTRFFMNGEETSGGRAFVHTVTGADAGQSYEFAALGHAAWENVVARPVADDRTVVLGTDDTHPNGDAVNAKGRVYVYFGDKQSSGTDLEKAGLRNGTTYAIKVNGAAIEDRSATANLGLDGDGKASFSLVNDGSGTNFLRPEDIAWDTQNPDRAYFVTTDGLDDADPTSRTSRLWRITLHDVNDPAAGGVIELLIDGRQPGQPQMMDNLTIAADGTVLIQEDVGNTARLGKLWRYDPNTKTTIEVAAHDPARFLLGAPGFLTQDEESSGIIDVTTLFDGVAGYDTDTYQYFLLDVQAHYALTDPALVEGGQLLLMAVQAVPEPGSLSLMAAMLGFTLYGARRKR